MIAWMATFLFILTPTISFAAPGTAPVEKLFVPSGFDDNDNAEVMIHGEFTDSCQKLGAVEVKSLEGNRFEVTTSVEATAPGLMCAQQLVPYLGVVKLGVLKQGVYEVVVNPGEHEVKSTISIGKSNTTERDEHMYAPVQTADIVTADDGQQYLSLEGEYPLMLRGCARIVEVRQVRDAEDLLTVLPIMQIFEDERCTADTQSFKLKEPIEIPFEGKGLLHVRVMSGESYNKLIVE